MAKWISVKDDMPKEIHEKSICIGGKEIHQTYSDPVFIIYKTHGWDEHYNYEECYVMTIGDTYNGTFCANNMDSQYAKVEYWMEITEPPVKVSCYD